MDIKVFKNYGRRNGRSEVSQELKYSINKVIFNKESKVNELKNLCTLKVGIHHREWEPAFCLLQNINDHTRKTGN